MDESLGSTSSTTARLRSAMKLSIGIPVLFAALGSITLILNATPKVAMNSHIANSKDRGTVQNRLREIGKNSPDSFYDFRKSIESIIE